MTDQRAIQERKDAIRQAIREKRQNLKNEWIAETSATIQRRILQLDEFKKAQIISCYMALPREVQTGSLIVASWEQEKRVCVPCFHEAEGVYAWAWCEPGDPINMGHWRVPELPTIRWAETQPDIVITPAVALDSRGRRLGHGGGHYDRLLSGTSALKVAPAFAFQIVDEIPTEEWDETVDLILTENDLFKNE